eukprot:TRINITY_DN5014_c0_g1_i1.p1 TRINITY_DN5014_c0_g1~~TRINITY_DN5014_c0_g1_i1.p1  ORF type:complete len:1164 (-),score=301.55 TRINITY_DN5014_c0_g1_i1:116-3607(-)
MKATELQEIEIDDLNGGITETVIPAQLLTSIPDFPPNLQKTVSKSLDQRDDATNSRIPRYDFRSDPWDKVYWKEVWNVRHSSQMWVAFFGSLILNGSILLALLGGVNLFTFASSVFATCLCWLIFTVLAVSQSDYTNGFFLNVGIGYAFAGVFYMLSRAAGMPGIMPANYAGVNRLIQLALCARFVEILSIMTGAAVSSRIFRGWKPVAIAFVIWALVFTFFISLVVWWDIFPDCVDDGTSKSTEFRVAIEYTCMSLFIVCWIAILVRRRHFSPNVFVFLFIAILLRVVSAIFNAQVKYILTDTVTSVSGNTLRNISFTFLFLSVGVSLLRNPIDTLFYNLNLKNVALQNEKSVVSWMIEQVPAIAILLDKDASISHVNQYAYKSLGLEGHPEKILLKNFFDIFHIGKDPDAHAHAKELYQTLLKFDISEGKCLPLRSFSTSEGNRIIEWNLKAIRTTSPALLKTKQRPGSSTNGSLANSVSASADLGRSDSSASGKPDVYVSFRESGSKNAEVLGEVLDGIQILCIGKDVTSKIERENLLLEAKNDAVAVAQMKETFVANVSHELRTPLNCIVGVTDLLQLSPMPESQRVMVSMVRTASNSLIALINDLLDFAKFNQKQLKLIYAPIHLRKFVESCLISVSFLYQENSTVDFGYRVFGDCPKIIDNDEIRLRQVIFNLLSNAIKFTQKGQIVVAVRTTHATPPRLRFSISDSGIGMRKEDLDQLFERFFQADDGVGVSRRPGTGIGLSITKQIIELMGGHIEASSTYGEGTTISFEVPITHSPNHEVKVVSGPLFTLQASKEPSDDELIIPPHILNVKQKVSFFLKNKVIAKLVVDSLTDDYGYDGQVFETSVQLCSFLSDILCGKLDDQYLFLVTDVEFSTCKDVYELLKELKTTKEVMIHLIMVQPNELQLRTPEDVVPLERHFRVDFVNRVIEQSKLLRFLRKDVQRQLATQQQMMQQYIAKSSSDENSSSNFESATGSYPSNYYDSVLERSLESTRLLRILVVEDNRTNQKVMTMMLERVGRLTYDIVENGQEAVDAFIKNTYDLILMDCQMPIMDGVTATREIRRIEAERTEKAQLEFEMQRSQSQSFSPKHALHTHICALTANALADEKQKCLEAGMDDYMIKPLSFASLTAKLDTMRDSLRPMTISKEAIIDGKG